MSFVLRASRTVERLPAPLFALLLLAVGFVGAGGRGVPGLVTYAFMLGDWLLVALLPRFGRSHGPAQPQTLALAVLRAPFALLPGPVALAAQSVGTCLVAYAFWFEPHEVRVTHERLRSPKLGPGPPLRILHFGDLHAERVTRRERQVVELAQALAPDLIVFSGDFLSLARRRDPASHEACRWVFERLSAPLGVFAVSGSPAVDDDEVMRTLLEGLPVRRLRDERLVVEHRGHRLDLVGLSCTHRPFVDGPRLLEVLENGHARGNGRPFTLLLYHAPDLAPEAAEAGIDLQLSGHTHGGQVRLPFYGALVTASLYGKALEVGRLQLGGLTLYVTRGIGMEGAGAPRVRFLCPPEIVLWELGGS